MKKIFSLAILGLSLFVVSCKKDKNDIGGPSSTQKKLKETTYDENWKFSYNQNGSVKEMALPAYNYKQLFSYTAGSVEIQSTTNGKMTSKGIYTLSNGKPVKLDRTNYDAMGQPTNSYTELFEYNAKGLLKKKTYPAGNFEMYEYDGNDNLIRITHHNEQGIAGYKTEYTYGNQKDLFPQYGYLNSTVEGNIFPPFAKYLPVSKIETDLSTNDIAYHTLVSYELDADGYVIKGHAISQMANYSDTHWTNTY
jgi:YD repeat-containing protein